MVVKQEVAAEITVLGQERIEKEQKSRERLKAGELGVDSFTVCVTG